MNFAASLCMIVASVLVLVGAALFGTPSASAAPFGILRPLQSGPIGDSPQFMDTNKLEAETSIDLLRHWGKIVLNDDSLSRMSNGSLSSRIAAGGAITPSKEFTASAYTSLTVGSDSDISRTRITPKAELDTGLYQHEAHAMVTFRMKPIVAGGSIGVHMYGSETKTLTYDDGTYTSEISSAAMPILSLFGGVQVKQFTGTFGVRFFSMGEAIVEATDATGEMYEYDIVRRHPGELHLDGRIQLGQADLAGSVAYVLTKQASAEIDENSMRFTTDPDGRRERRTGGELRHADHVRAAFGGRFRPDKRFSIKGSVSYIAPSYADQAYASLEHQNLGGFGFDVGAEATVQKIRGFLHAGYRLDTSVDYTQEDSSRAEVNLDQTQTVPINEGDEVEISQGSWNIVLGAGTVL